MVLFGGEEETFKTKCTKSKMSESDLFKRNGIAVHDLSNKYHKNFNQYEVLQQKLTSSTSSSSKTGTENSDQSGNNKFHNSPSGARIAGGRLQFFKDGKFILELASSREGERLGWVSVPRKTYWPPTISSNSSVSFQKHESSTSLSYSDDNSSIQSSPWQRDHCWKQSLPRRNISKEMCLYFHRPSILQPVAECLKWSKKKCRRPQDKNFQIHQVQKVTAEAVPIPTKRTEHETIEDSNNTQNDNNETTQQLQEETAQDADSPSSDGKIEEKAVLNGKKPKSVVRATLASVVKKLSEKNPTIVSAQNARMSQLSISNHHHVSPRKRFLRELEKVSLEDKAMKRSRAKTSTTISGSMASIPGSTNIKSPGGRHVNGNSTVAAETISLSPSVQHTNNSRPISSYSITSLLGHNSDSSSNKNGRKEETSPLSASHQHKEFEQNRNIKTSPEQISQKMFSSVVALSAGSGRKRASPIYHPHSPSPISSEQSKQSSNLSSSPEQQHQQQQHNLNKYRQHPYIYNPLHSMMGSPSVSSPNYTINPRYSPSPNAENYSQKFRSNYLTSSSPSASYNSSPSHQLIKRESPVSTSSPTTSCGGRKTPPYSAKYVESPTHQTNFNSHFGHYQSMVAKDRERELSPSRSPKKYEKHAASTAPTSNSSSGSGRTVPKKNASLRQQYDSPTDSSAEHLNEANYKQHLNKLKNYSKELVGGNSKGQSFKMSEYDNESRNDSADNYVNSSTGMNIDALHNPVIRPSLIPSLSSAAANHSSHPSLYYMYNHPLHHPQSSLQAHIQAQHNPFLPPTAVPSYYHLYAAAAASAAVFRPLWPHYPGVSATTAQHHHSILPPSANSRIHGSLMNFSGSNGLLVHPNLAEPPGSWEQVARHSMSPNEIMRVKEESNSDVPLNLSKH